MRCGPDVRQEPLQCAQLLLVQSPPLASTFWETGAQPTSCQVVRWTRQSGTRRALSGRHWTSLNAGPKGRKSSSRNLSCPVGGPTLHNLS